MTNGDKIIIADKTQTEQRRY